MVLDPSVLLVTNIDSVHVQHITYDDFRAQGLMDVEKLRKFIEQNGYKRVVVIIDECQRYFAGLKDPQEFFFFEYSRHLGLDIFLIVQSVTALPRRLVELAEFVVEAQPRNLRTIGFRYFLRDSKTGMKLSVQGVKVDKTVFKMYKSFDVKESATPAKTQLTKIAVGAIVIVGVLITAKLAINHAFNADMNNVKQKTETISRPKENKKTEQKQAVNKGTKIESIKDLGQWIKRPGKSNTKPNKDIAGVIEIENPDGTFETILIARDDEPAVSPEERGANKRAKKEKKVKKDEAQYVLFE